MTDVEKLCEHAQQAALKLATVSTRTKNDALKAMADALLDKKSFIIDQNKKDMAEGEKQNIGDALLDRLMLDDTRVEEMSAGLRDIASLRDPVGEIVSGWRLQNGLIINKVRVPLGVIGMIYEARPNVTVDAAGLCLKTGNAVVLRSGSVALNSCLALTDVVAEAATKAGIPGNAIQSIRTPDREAVYELMGMNKYVDVLIPRGGASLIQSVIQKASVPVIETGVGNCHVYIDKDADLDMAVNIIINAKCQRPGVCNAAESMLVHRDIARDFLPVAIKSLSDAGVTLVGDKRSREISPEIEEATNEDWTTEYLALKLSVKVVLSLEEAIDHINTYGTKHSESIITEDYSAAMRFTDTVDAAAVYVNASTRFTDGGQYGLGAEIGISTQKLHVRGPMGLESLTSTKYVVYGSGQIRE